MKQYIVLYKVQGVRMTLQVSAEDLFGAIEQFYDMVERFYPQEDFISHDEVFELEHFKTNYINRL